MGSAAGVGVGAGQGPPAAVVDALQVQYRQRRRVGEGVQGRFPCPGGVGDHGGGLGAGGGQGAGEHLPGPGEVAGVVQVAQGGQVDRGDQHYPPGVQAEEDEAGFGGLVAEQVGHGGDQLPGTVHPHHLRRPGGVGGLGGPVVGLGG